MVLHLHEVVHDEGVADLLAREDLAAGEGDDVVAGLVPREGSPENAFFENAFFENFAIFLAGSVSAVSRRNFVRKSFCKKICVRQHFSSSTRFPSFCTAAISKFSQKIGLKNHQIL